MLAAVMAVAGLAVGSWLYAGGAPAKKGAAAVGAAKGAPKAEKPKAPEEPDDGIQGMYVAAAGPGKVEAKVIGQGAGEFKVLLSAGGKAVELTGKLDGGKVPLKGAAGETGTIADKKLTAEAAGTKFDLAYTVPKSPTEGEKPPAGAVILLAYEPGKAPSLDQWTNDTWVANPDGSINKGKGDNKTKQPLADMQLHVEFMCPYMPQARGQARGNSGVYLMDRYEVQVLDSWGLPVADNDVGGLYKVATPKVAACFPPLVWQTYDMTFHAPKFDASGKKVKDATVTALLNGVKIHDNVTIPGPTGGAASKEEAREAPLRLQDHGNTVKFRNIWVVPLKD
jgi:hypothetical protein